MSFSDIDKFPGKIIVNWDGLNSSRQKMPEFDHVAIFLKSLQGSFADGSKEVGAFKVAGKVYLDVPAGDYTVRLVTVFKDGTFGGSTSEVQINGIQAEIKIEAPTLATGFTVAPVQFAIAATWDGRYATKSFIGFSRIEIYASCTDLGPTSSDSAFFKNKKVGEMTVNDVTNKITIGLSALRGACGITGSEVYARRFYFYQISVNVRNIGYEVDGKLTWTQFESAATSPSQ